MIRIDAATKWTQVPRVLGLVATAAILVAVAAEPAFAASAAQRVSIGQARLSGRVTDAVGNPIAGVRVVLTHSDSGDTYEVETDERGRWVKGGLGRGNWSLDFYAAGFSPEQMSASVTATRHPPMEAVLEPGASGGTPTSGGVGPRFGGELGEAVAAGNALYDAGQYEAALAAFEGILATYPEEEEPDAYLVHLNAGNSALELERFDSALEHYRKALARDPDNTSGHIGVAKVHLAGRRLQEALEELEMIDPGAIQDPIVFYNVGALLFGERQPKEAGRYFTLALERNPGFVDAHFQLALCLIQQEDNQAAREHLEKVIELAPDSENAALARDFLQIIGFP